MTGPGWPARLATPPGVLRRWRHTGSCPLDVGGGLWWG
jgi:hypothetical protein